MRLTDLIEKDHRDVEALLQELQQSGPSSGLIGRLRLLLLTHTQAEEETVYAVLDERGGNEELLEDAYDDHDEVEDLLDRLEGAPAEDQPGLIAEIAQAVEEHVAVEESALFDLLRKLPEDECAAIASGFEQRRDEVMREVGARS